MTKSGNLTIDEYLKERSLSIMERKVAREAYEVGNSFGYENGFRQGSTFGANSAINSLLALICILMHDNYGWGAIRCSRLIENMNQSMIERGWDMDNLIEEVAEKCKLQMSLEDNGLGMDE